MTKNKEQPISVNQLDKTVNSQLEKYQKDSKSIISYETEGDKTDITVKHLLSVSDMYSLVEDVVNTLFDDDIYNSSLFEIIYYKAILGYYTNIDTSISNDKLSILINCTDIIKSITAKINESQLMSINKSIEKAAEFRKENILSSQRQRIEKEQNEILSSSREMIELFEKIGEGFKDIDVDELMKSIDKIADNTFKKNNSQPNIVKERSQK